MQIAIHASPSLSISSLIEHPQLLDELETEDLFSLKSVLQEDLNPEFDKLWELVLARTGSLS